MIILVTSSQISKISELLISFVLRIQNLYFTYKKFRKILYFGCRIASTPSLSTFEIKRIRVSFRREIVIRTRIWISWKTMIIQRKICITCMRFIAYNTKFHSNFKSNTREKVGCYHILLPSVPYSSRRCQRNAYIILNTSLFSST